jgi:hypothetical protein
MTTTTTISLLWRRDDDDEQTQRRCALPRHICCRHRPARQRSNRTRIRILRIAHVRVQHRQGDVRREGHLSDTEVPAAPTLVAATKPVRVRRANFNGNKVGPVDASDGGTNASIRGVVMAKMEMSSISTLRSSLEPKVNVPVSKESSRPRGRCRRSPR